MNSVHIFGCDTDLDSFTVAGVDEVGRLIDQRRCRNNQRGFAEFAAMCRRHDIDEVGIEGASGYGRQLATYLIDRDITVVEVPTRVTVAGRDRNGKTDVDDAVAVARAVAAERGHEWGYDPQAEALRVLVHRRERLVRTQTADINHLRALLVEVDAERASELSRLRTIRALKPFTRVRYGGNIHRETVAAEIRDLARTCIERRRQIDGLTTRLPELLPAAAHRMIDQIHGAGVVTAAILFAELAGTTGFDTDAQLASWAGVAPIPVSSGRTDRHRLNRGGNRQANRAIHIITVTQHRSRGPAADYINRRISEGKTRKEAIRAAKRHVTRHIWKHIYKDPQLT